MTPNENAMLDEVQRLAKELRAVGLSVKAERALAQKLSGVCSNINDITVGQLREFVAEARADD